MVDESIKTPEMTVSEIMIAPVITLTPKMKLWQVAELFVAKKISGAPLVDESGKMISIIGQGSLLRLLAKHGTESNIARCMSELTPIDRMITLRKDALFKTAYLLFLKHGIHRIPILDGTGKVVGLLSRSSVFKMIVEAHHGKKIPAA